MYSSPLTKSSFTGFANLQSMLNVTSTIWNLTEFKLFLMLKTFSTWRFVNELIAHRNPNLIFFLLFFFSKERKFPKPENFPILKFQPFNNTFMGLLSFIVPSDRVVTASLLTFINTSPPFCNNKEQRR
jgi:hypothetical protein